MLLKKLFSKFKKEINSSIIFNYDENYVNINIDFSGLNVDIKNFIEMSMFDLEHIIQRENNIFRIEHKNIYELENEYLKLLKFPKEFKVYVYSLSDSLLGDLTNSGETINTVCADDLCSSNPIIWK